MTTYRAWWTLCTLPDSAWDHKKSNSEKPLRYKRERRVEDIEAKDEEEVRIKLHWQNLSHHDRLRVKNGLGEIVPARQTYADIFAVCPARDGVRCKEIDGSWICEDRELFSLKEIESIKTKAIEINRITPEEWEEEKRKIQEAVGGAR